MSFSTENILDSVAALSPPINWNVSVLECEVQLVQDEPRKVKCMAPEVVEWHCLSTVVVAKSAHLYSMCWVRRSKVASRDHNQDILNTRSYSLEVQHMLNLIKLKRRAFRLVAVWYCAQWWQLAQKRWLEICDPDLLVMNSTAARRNREAHGDHFWSWASECSPSWSSSAHHSSGFHQMLINVSVVGALPTASAAANEKIAFHQKSVERKKEFYFSTIIWNLD